ncbi:hypothetical protein [Marinobacterium jannaschii]|uniref:hypothetical protein n=1 Tax=Marinobacterium jannaschii TaxID=64970 RepID=UPI000488C1E2|nr:hypothetical protein [Marinobacterium jannaschii]
MKRISVLSGLLLYLCLPAAAAADEVKQVIGEAIEAYEEEAYGEAIESLNYATQLLQKLKTNTLSAFLPPAPDGWEKGKSEDNEFVAMGKMFGGSSGSIAAARYTQGSKQIELSLAADSPLINQYGAILANPALAQASGQGEVIRIKRSNALVTEKEITMMYSGRFLIRASFSKTPKEEVISLIRQIDFPGLKKF